MTLSYHLQLADGTYEEAPMGIFEVSEANRKVRTLEIKGYDYMLHFERNFNGLETIGTAFDFVNLCCTACKVEMAQDQARSIFPSTPTTISKPFGMSSTMWGRCWEASL